MYTGKTLACNVGGGCVHGQPDADAINQAGEEHGGQRGRQRQQQGRAGCRRIGGRRTDGGQWGLG